MAKMKTASSTADPQSTLLRSVRVLFGLVEAGHPMTVTRLANGLGLPASTTHRILNVLRQAGYVAQNEESGTYGPGLAFFRVSTMMAAASTFPTIIHATLTELVERCGESAFYAAYLNETQRLRFVTTLHSHHAIQYVLRGDQTYSLLWGASGHSIASWLPESTLRTIYDREKDTAEGIAILPSWEALLKHIRQVRAVGHAISHGQRHEGSHAIAASVVGSLDTPVGCVGIAMPSSRQRTAKIHQCVELITAAAAQLSLTARSIHFPAQINS